MAEPFTSTDPLRELVSKSASDSRRAEIVASLIASGRLDERVPVPQDGSSVLTFLIENGHTALAIELIDAGAQVSQESDAGYQPVHSACALNDSLVLEVLLNRGASVHAKTKDGSTAFHYALADGVSPHVLELLLSATKSPSSAMLKKTRLLGANGTSCWELLARYSSAQEIVMALEILDRTGALEDLMKSTRPASVSALSNMRTALGQKEKQVALGWLNARAQSWALDQTPTPAPTPARPRRF